MKNKFSQSLISNYCSQQQSDEQTNQSQLAQSRKTILKLHRGLKQLEDPEPQMPTNHQLSQNYKPNMQNYNVSIPNYKAEQCLPDYWQLQNRAHLYKVKNYPLKSPLSVNNQEVKHFISEALQSLQHLVSGMHQQYSIIISGLFLKITHLQEQISLLPIKYRTKNRVIQNKFFEKEHSYLQQISRLKKELYQLQEKEKIWERQKQSYYRNTIRKQIKPMNNFITEKKRLNFPERKEKNMPAREQVNKQVEDQQNERSLLEDIEQSLESSNLKISQCHRMRVNSNGMSLQMLPVTIVKNEHKYQQKGQQEQEATVRKKIGGRPLGVHSEGDLISIENNQSPAGLSSPYIQSEDVMIVDEQILSELSSSELQEDTNANGEGNRRSLQQDMYRKDSLFKADIKPEYEQSQVQQFSQPTMAASNLFNQHPSHPSNQHPCHTPHQNCWHSYTHTLDHHKFYSSTPQRKSQPIQSIINIPQLQSGYAFTGQEKYLLQQIQHLKILMTNQHSSQPQPQYHQTINKNPQQIYQNTNYSLKHQLKPLLNTSPNSTSKKMSLHKTTFKNQDPKQQQISNSQEVNRIRSLSKQLQASIKRENNLSSVLLHLREELSVMKKELNECFIPCQYCDLRDSLMQII